MMKMFFRAAKFAVAISLVFATPALAIEKCGSAKRVTCVVDGDTIWHKGEKIRIIGYNVDQVWFRDKRLR